MSGGPLRAVLEAIDDGALTAFELRRATGLPDETIRTALEQLQRIGLLSAEQVELGCPPQGCGTCALAQTCGPALVGLTRVRST